MISWSVRVQISNMEISGCNLELRIFAILWRRCIIEAGSGCSSTGICCWRVYCGLSVKYVWRLIQCILYWVGYPYIFYSMKRNGLDAIYISLWRRLLIVCVQEAYTEIFKNPIYVPVECVMENRARLCWMISSWSASDARNVSEITGFR